MQERAVAIAGLYDHHHRAAGREPWHPADFLTGFVGDVGDLAKLVMAVEGRRVIPQARERLGHELADCLCSVLVLAHRYDVDLSAEFARMTEGIERHLGGPEPRDGRSPETGSI